MPAAVRTDNGTEIASRAFDAWACRHGIDHQFICLAKPVEIAVAKSLG